MTRYVEAIPIPEIRAELHVLSKKWRKPRLAVLAEATKRRYSGRKARADQPPITCETCQQVRVFYKRHPDMHLSKIAIRFGIVGSGAGRVSEILNGMRDGRSYEEAHGL